MFKSIFVLLTIFLFTINHGLSQTINWGSLKEDQKHIININIGFDYSISYGVTYSYRLKSKLPILLNVDFSVPAINNGFDDLKTKIGWPSQFTPSQ